MRIGAIPDRPENAAAFFLPGRQTGPFLPVPLLRGNSSRSGLIKSRTYCVCLSRHQRLGSLKQKIPGNGDGDFSRANVLSHGFDIRDIAVQLADNNDIPVITVEHGRTSAAAASAFHRG